MMVDSFDCATRGAACIPHCGCVSDAVPDRGTLSHTEYQPIINKIFKIVDTQRDGLVPYQEVFYALAQLFPSRNDELAELFFAMYDADGR